MTKQEKEKIVYELTPFLLAACNMSHFYGESNIKSDNDIIKRNEGYLIRRLNDILDKLLVDDVLANLSEEDKEIIKGVLK